MTTDNPTPASVPDTARSLAKDDVQVSDVIVSAAHELVYLGFDNDGEWSLLDPDDAEIIGHALIAHAAAARKRGGE